MQAILKKIVTCLTGFAGISVLLAADPVEVELLNISQGLSNNRVNAVYQDSTGFMWFGTYDGLNRYDGYDFVVYRQEAFNNSSLPSNNINDITEGNNGLLWISTDAGICSFDRAKNSFTRYYVPDNAATGEIAVDHTGAVLILTQENLFRLNPQTGVFTRINISEGVLQNHFFNMARIFLDDAGHVWVGTRYGLYVMDEKDTVLTKTTLSGQLIFDFIIDERGQFWIATSKGLVLFNRALYEWKLFIPPYKGYSRIVGLVDPGHDEGLCLISNNGLIRFNPTTYQFSIPDDLSLFGRLFDMPTVSDVLLDNSRILWIGTDQGLVRHDFKSKIFASYTQNETSYPRLLSKNLFGLFKDDDGRIWMGTRSDGLMIMDREKGNIELYSAEGKGKYFLPMNRVLEIFRDKRNRIWVCDNKIFFYDPNSESFKSFSEYMGIPPEEVPLFNRIYEVLEIIPGYYLLGTRNGLWHYDEMNRSFEQDTLLVNDSVSIKVLEVTALEHDWKGNVWIACNAGIIRMNRDLGSWRFYGKGEETGITGRQPYCILCDHTGTIWIGTSGGIGKYDPELDRFKPYTIKDGLPNDFIYAMVEDQHGHIWISTNQGLTMLDTENDIFINYGLKDGLQSMEFNLHSVFRAGDNEILFGGVDGLSAFYPDSLAHMVNSPATVITGIRFMDNQHDESLWFPGQEEIRINDHQTIQIKFSALDYSSSTHNNYRYELSKGGVNPGFISLGRENSVILSGLKYGTYTFRVYGSNSDGIWSKNPALVQIIVSAPFYRHRLFFISLIALFVVLVGLVYRFQTKTLRQSNRILREKEIAAQEVLRQRNLLSRRNKNIEDSLMYAQRIQMAMFSTPRDIKRLYPESFVFQRPKDIVSGDFFWTRQIGNKIFLAAADCTGHGVPGAFMSLIGLELFRQIITGKELYKPAEILDELNRNFNIIFGNMEDISLKDGMDLSFCTFHTDTNIMEFAGAFNPVYLIRDREIIEIKGDRITVGPDNGFFRPPFTNQTIQLQKDDIIYMFSDGYADQFGGPEGKKFKFRRFRHLLLSIHHHSMDKQRKLLEDSIIDWIGDHEQVDDIMILGIKPYKNID